MRKIMYLLTALMMFAPCDGFAESTGTKSNALRTRLVTSQAPLSKSAFSAASGSVAFDDSVSIQAKIVNGGPVGKSNDGENIRWNVTMKNSFAAGNTVDSFATGLGMNFAVDNGSTALHFLNGSDVGAQDLTFVVIKNVGTGNFIMFQEYNGTNNFVSDTTEYQDILSFVLRWNNSYFSALSWANRFLKPSFIDTADFGTFEAYTEVPDTSGLITATRPNSLLSYSTFDSVEVTMARFSSSGYSSDFTCGVDTLKLINNFSVGSFSVRYHISGGFCIYSVSGLPEGISATKVTDTSWDIFTDGLFDSISVRSTDTTIALLSIGLEGTDFPGRLRRGKPVIIVDTSVLKDKSGNKQYAAAVSSSYKVRNRFDSNGNGCPSCGFSPPPDLKTTDGSVLPTVFTLHQNLPNPFNPVTKIRLDMPVASSWNITIYNVMGQKVKTFTGESGIGTVVVEWDAREAASGMYFYKAVAGDFQATRKMILLK
ncbi:T9SS type A sorting domain-containing protein [Gemmatimonas aurantiaca]|nr:T9SS type A sorting domain-containing protein [Gemmatimonas aurantiaca]